MLLLSYNLRHILHQLETPIQKKIHIWQELKLYINEIYLRIVKNPNTPYPIIEIQTDPVSISINIKNRINGIKAITIIMNFLY